MVPPCAKVQAPFTVVSVQRTDIKEKVRQFADVKDATQQGKGKGDVYHWDIFYNVATQGSTLTETNTMPESNFTISQGTLTITEAGKLLAALFSSSVNKFRTVIVGLDMAFPA